MFAAEKILQALQVQSAITALSSMFSQSENGRMFLKESKYVKHLHYVCNRITSISRTRFPLHLIKFFSWSMGSVLLMLRILRLAVQSYAANHIAAMSLHRRNWVMWEPLHRCLSNGTSTAGIYG